MTLAISLAYAGIHFGLFLLPYAEPGISLRQVVGTEQVMAEIMRLIVGGIAIAWTVPATAWLAARLNANVRHD